MTVWAFLAGVLGGAITALVAPWVKWFIDRKRAQRDERRELVASWRQGIWAVQPLPDNDQRDQVVKEPWYHTLRRHLSSDVRNRIEAGGGRLRLTVITYSPLGDGPVEALLDEVDRIEREWGLP